MTAQIASIGHNNPPTDGEIINQRMAEKYPELRKAVNDLSAAANAAPREIENEEQAAHVTDLIKQISIQDKDVNAVRTKEKQYFLDCGRAVDAFFNLGRQKLEVAKTKLSQTLQPWLDKKAAEERARREEAERLAKEAAAKAQAEALELEQQGKTTEATVQLQHALNAETEAYKAEQAADAKPASMARSYGNSGAVAGLRTVWVGEVTDRAQLDMAALGPYFSKDAIDKAVNAFVRAGNRELKGARIYQRNDAVVR